MTCARAVERVLNRLPVTPCEKAREWALRAARILEDPGEVWRAAPMDWSFWLLGAQARFHAPQRERAIHVVSWTLVRANYPFHPKTLKVAHAAAWYLSACRDTERALSFGGLSAEDVECMGDREQDYVGLLRGSSTSRQPEDFLPSLLGLWLNTCGPHSELRKKLHDVVRIEHVLEATNAYGGE